MDSWLSGRHRAGHFRVVPRAGPPCQVAAQALKDFQAGPTLGTIDRA
jgi:hypothetical protein